MKTWRCQGYRGMDTFKEEFTVEADTYEDASRKAFIKRPFADTINVIEVANEG